MTPRAIQQAAQLLWSHWQHTTRISTLPADCRPHTRKDGYAIQAELAACSGHGIMGWKIAATTESGQRHINVNGPIAGRLLRGKVLGSGADISLGDNHMRVAEAELVFRMAHDLPPRPAPYGQDEVMAAVGAILPGIEVPDSRFEDFCSVGDAQLIAENACAAWFVLGRELALDWRALDLASYPVRLYRNGVLAGEGTGAMVLGDPKIALAWIANELAALGIGLRAGDIVTTGTVVTPVKVAPGDFIHGDFGVLGALDARII